MMKTLGCVSAWTRYFLCTSKLTRNVTSKQHIQIATVVAIASLGVFAPPSFAQDASDEIPTEIPIEQSTELLAEETETPTIRINVTGELLDLPVFTPFRREGTVRETSQPVYVINRQQIEAQGARTIDEALR
ncbi:MAG: hypothetical protein AB4042_06750, partial [Leptolyngbyaceae cyanobacterium]